jgi:DNA primase
MDAVDEIKQRLSIEDVLSEYVELKRAGRNFKGLSPFSNEKTPSLMVSPEKQIWHDFSSGKGGNMFSFVMEVEGLDFKGVLELLARKAGVDLSQYQRVGGGNTKLKKRFEEANELAAKFYQAHLSQNKTAIDYVFKKRNINKETALAFKLGYAPNNGSALSDFLTKKGFTVDELQKAGLTARRSGRASDMFRGRIMIPLMDPTGNVIGFTGRILEDDPNAPKYLNTPQTLLYDKGRHVFGLHLAKESIRKKKFAVVVEGNMDVVASYQAGARNVVASAGTAMTEMHLKALERFVHDVRLSFDQDAAGLAATERVIPIASKAGVSLSMITVEGAKDPDELIQKDPKAWEVAIEKPEYALDWLISQYQKRLDLSTAQGKREFSDVTLAVIRNLNDQVEQEHYIEKVGKILGVSKDALLNKLAAPVAKPRPKKRVETPKIDPRTSDVIKAQNHFMCLVLMVPNLRDYAQQLTIEMFPEEHAQELFTFLSKNKDFKPEDLVKQIKANNTGGEQGGTLFNLSDYVKMLVLLYEELYSHLETIELRYEAARLQVRLIERYVKAKKAALAEEIRQADEQQIEPLLQQAKALDTLLKLTKEGEPLDHYS